MKTEFWKPKISVFFFPLDAICTVTKTPQFSFTVCFPYPFMARLVSPSPFSTWSAIYPFSRRFRPKIRLHFGRWAPICESPRDLYLGEKSPALLSRNRVSVWSCSRAISPWVSPIGEERLRSVVGLVVSGLASSHFVPSRFDFRRTSPSTSPIREAFGQFVVGWVISTRVYTACDIAFRWPCALRCCSNCFPVIDILYVLCLDCYPFCFARFCWWTLLAVSFIGGFDPLSLLFTYLFVFIVSSVCCWLVWIQNCVTSFCCLFFLSVVVTPLVCFVVHYTGPVCGYKVPLSKVSQIAKIKLQSSVLSDK